MFKCFGDLARKQFLTIRDRGRSGEKTSMSFARTVRIRQKAAKMALHPNS